MVEKYHKLREKKLKVCHLVKKRLDHKLTESFLITNFTATEFVDSKSDFFPKIVAQETIVILKAQEGIKV